MLPSKCSVFIHTAHCRYLSRSKHKQINNLLHNQRMPRRDTMVWYIGISQRKLARRFNVGKTAVSRILLSDNIVFRKRRKAPKYTEAQLERIPRCCRALRRVDFVNKLIVMDDEKYFTCPTLR
jgi:hypothetical protein